MSSTSVEAAWATGLKRPWFDQLAREGLLGRLRRLREGTLVVADRGETERFGTSAEGSVDASMEVHHPRFYRRIATGGSLGAAEAFLDGDWTCPDLAALFRLLIRNPQVTSGMDSGWARGAAWLSRAAHVLRLNTRTGSRRNIEAHYDLGNDFFRLFLDETMMYSSGIFPTPESTLYEGSVEKLERICRQLNLSPQDHVLEIGTGWGGFALHAAREFGCRVTSTTISQAQFEFARERIRAAGLENRVTLLREDYRDLTGTYDKLVSIEMIEAVGHQFFDTFFRHCSARLKPDGLMLLQGIVMNEQGYTAYLRSVDFIQKYIFPGGCLPSVLALGAAAARGTDMRLVRVDDFAAHYARTLHLWRERFRDALDEIRALGFSERFLRTWDYYFCYCEAAFEERYIGVVQMLFAKPGSRYDAHFGHRHPAERTQ